MLTPRPQVCGDLAQFITSNNLTKDEVIEKADKLDFPESVIEFFQGHLGQPYGGFPEPLRTKVIRDRQRIDGRPGANMKPYDFKKTKATLREKYGKSVTDCDVLSYCMYPKVWEAYHEQTEKYGDLR